MIDDDKLPTWLHTTLLLAIASAFAIPLVWSGVRAIATGHLEPMMGPELGQWWFGEAPRVGRAAMLSGCALVDAGLAFLAIGVAFSRWARDRAALRMLPWLLIALYVPLHFWAMSAK